MDLNWADDAGEDAEVERQFGMAEAENQKSASESPVKENLKNLINYNQPLEGTGFVIQEQVIDKGSPDNKTLNKFMTNPAALVPPPNLKEIQEDVISKIQ